MRRRNPKPGPRRWVRRGLALLLAAAGLYVYLVETEVKPRVEELAEYECRAIVVQAMNEAVSAEMQRTPALYQDLYTLTYAPNGALCAVQADTAEPGAAGIGGRRTAGAGGASGPELDLPAGQPERLERAGRAGP